MAKNIRICRTCGVVFDLERRKDKDCPGVTMGNISHSDTMNKFHIKSTGSLTQINATSVLQYQEREKR